MGGAEAVGSTWGMVPVRRHLKKACTAHISRSVASSYPVTSLAAFGLSGAFDNWDAINAPNLGQPIQPCPACHRMPAWAPSGARLRVLGWSTFGPHAIGAERFATVSSGLQR
jgi:hypothetical protein